MKGAISNAWRWSVVGRKLFHEGVLVSARVSRSSPFFVLVLFSATLRRPTFVSFVLFTKLPRWSGVPSSQSTDKEFKRFRGFAPSSLRRSDWSTFSPRRHWPLLVLTGFALLDPTKNHPRLRFLDFFPLRLSGYLPWNSAIRCFTRTPFKFIKFSTRWILHFVKNLTRRCYSEKFFAACR